MWIHLKQVIMLRICPNITLAVERDVRSQVLLGFWYKFEPAIRLEQLEQNDVQFYLIHLPFSV